MAVAVKYIHGSLVCLCLRRRHRIVLLMNYWDRIDSPTEVASLLKIVGYVRGLAWDAHSYSWGHLAVAKFRMIGVFSTSSYLFLTILGVAGESGGLRGVQEGIIGVIRCLNVHYFVSLKVLFEGWEVVQQGAVDMRGIFKGKQLWFRDWGSLGV